MAKLTDINLPVAAQKKSAKNIKTIPMIGDMVSRYNEACDTKKKADEVIEALKPTIQQIGLDAIFTHNLNNAGDTSTLISSVNLVETPTEAVEAPQALQVTWMKKDLKNDPKAVEAEFSRMLTLDGKKANINNYVEYEVVAKFNSDAFKDSKGKFSQDQYDSFTQAVSAVAIQLGIDNPLVCSKVLVPKADFHEKRWRTFGLEDNLSLQAVLPTQVNLKPIRDKE